MEMKYSIHHCALKISHIITYFWQVDELFREAPIKGSKFDYLEFTRILKHGKKEEDQ